MLRHIGLVTLAMTACAAFIPTKVNAATLSIRSIPQSIRGEVAAKPGDLIDIIFILTLDSGSAWVTPRNLETRRDPSELSVSTGLLWLVSQGRPINYSATDRQTDIARITYKVENPVRTGITDVWGTLTYDDNNVNVGEIPGLKAEVSNEIDVVPVPEPLTIFGTAIGLGCGVLFKRKSSKKTVF